MKGMRLTYRLHYESNILEVICDCAWSYKGTVLYQPLGKNNILIGIGQPYMWLIEPIEE